MFALNINFKKQYVFVCNPEEEKKNKAQIVVERKKTKSKEEISRVVTSYIPIAYPVVFLR